MAQANLRVAAGIGVFAALLLAAGPSAAVAIADPGGSHSGHSDKHDRSDSRGGSHWSDDNVTSGNRSSQKAIIEDSPRSKVGSGRESGTSDAGTADERSGSDYSPEPSGAFKPPKVTFGDGRTPGVQDTEREPRWRGGGADPASPPPPPPTIAVVDIAPPPSTNRTPRPPVIRQLVVAPAAELTDPMWGVAGLLLIPAAGAVLGYRQARAAQAVAKLGRHP
ncbi:MAG: hypothetical protein QOD39_1869 [Mycobacterium sp.]|nr:hypothetical protein [Mycobacterium sp.]